MFQGRRSSVAGQRCRRSGRPAGCQIDARGQEEESAAEGYRQTMNVESSVASAPPKARDAGELFEYSFAGPVTVKKGESAMLPFLQQKIETRKLLIYSESFGLNPMDAAEITNTTGKTLDGGPITVYDAGTYAGEALVETVKAGDKRLISYGVDLGTRVTTKFDSSRDVVREIHFRRGVLTARSAIEETKTYTIHNVDAKAEDADHRASRSVTATSSSTRSRSETTANAYRFEVKLAPVRHRNFSGYGRASHRSDLPDHQYDAGRDR